MTVSIRLVLADDHPLILDGLEALFGVAGDFAVVERCVTGDEALRAVERHRPDVLVLDIRMPGLDGLEVVRELRRRALPVRVVILTAAIEEREVLEAVRLGVAGVVLKEMAPRLLVQAVRKVHAGEQWVENRSLHGALERLLRREAGAQEAAGLLTPREVQLVQMVAQGLRNREIAERLGISPRTAESHRAKVMSKLGLRREADLVRFALRHGILPLDLEPIPAG